VGRYPVEPARARRGIAPPKGRASLQSPTLGCRTERLIVGCDQCERLMPPFCPERVDQLVLNRSNAYRNAERYKSPTCRNTVAWSQ
jgi:hypothetical protein